MLNQWQFILAAACVRDHTLGQPLYHPTAIKGCRIADRSKQVVSVHPG